EDQDERPRKGKKKKPQKKNSLLLWLLLGGGVVVLGGLAVVGGAVWWFFLRGKPVTGPGSVADPVAIKLFVPHKKGEKREVKVSFESTVETEGQAVGVGKHETRGSFEGTLQTLEVDSKGAETRVRFTVAKFTFSQDGKELTPFPPGTVLTGTRMGKQ